DWSGFSFSAPPEMFQVVTAPAPYLKPPVVQTPASTYPAAGAVAQAQQKSKAVETSVSKSLSKVYIGNYKKPTNEHHIVAWASKYAARAREILLSVGIDPKKDKINIVTVKTGLHIFLHNQVYYGAVNAVIISAYYAGGELYENRRKSAISALLYLKGVITTASNLSPN
ncbi:MAG: hypothetical protein ACLSAP_11930, partial [Oscillospiraceae bacterium]